MADEEFAAPPDIKDLPLPEDISREVGRRDHGHSASTRVGSSGDQNGEETLVGQIAGLEEAYNSSTVALEDYTDVLDGLIRQEEKNQRRITFNLILGMAVIIAFSLIGRSLYQSDRNYSVILKNKASITQICEVANENTTENIQMWDQALSSLENDGGDAALKQKLQDIQAYAHQNFMIKKC